LGVLFALRAAATRPDRGPALVMLGPAPRCVRGEGMRYGMSGEVLAGFAAGLREDYRGTLERFIALEAVGPDRARRELRTLRNEVFSRGEPPAAALAQGLDLLHAVDQRPLLGGL